MKFPKPAPTNIGFCIKVISHGDMKFPKPAPTNIGFCIKVISNSNMKFPKRFTAYVEKP